MNKNDQTQNERNPQWLYNALSPSTSAAIYNRLLLGGRHQLTALTACNSRRRFSDAHCSRG